MVPFLQERKKRRALVPAAAALVPAAAVIMGMWLTLNLSGHDSAHSSPHPSSPAVTAVTLTVTDQGAPPSTNLSLASVMSGGKAYAATSPARSRTLVLPILEYHSVDLRPLFGLWGRRLTLSARKFAAEMNYLASHGYHPITLDRLYSGLSDPSSLPARSVALTFDDGYLDNYTIVFPVLRARHFVATFFVITASVGRPGYVT